MTEAVLFKIGCIVAVLVGYGLIRWRLMHATHGFRVNVGCDADRWAADPRVPEDTRQVLRGWADGMYRPATPWLLVLATLIAVSIPYRRFDRKFEAVTLSLAPEIRKDIGHLNVRLAFAAVTASPLASLAVMLILLVGVLFRASVDTVRKRIETIPGTYRLRAW